MYNQIARIFFCCLAAALVSSSYSEETEDGRVVNGQVINVASAPYMVRLKHINGEHWCGGTLVTLQHVVTAAHCMDFVNPIVELVVVSGVSTLDEPGQQRTIVNFEKPAAYTRNTFNMDYAVLKLNAPMILNVNTKPINLCSSPLQAGSTVQVSGFGRQFGGGERSYHLRSVSLPVITNVQCGMKFPLTDSMFCTAMYHHGPCQYDSGGPVVRGGELCGIVSWGRADCDYSAGSPAVFTNVHFVSNFIQRAIQML